MKKPIINKVIKQINGIKNIQKKAKIAMLGLNPHNAELRNNSEEKLIIMPVISKLKKKKV